MSQQCSRCTAHEAPGIDGPGCLEEFTDTSANVGEPGVARRSVAKFCICSVFFFALFDSCLAGYTACVGGDSPRPTTISEWVVTFCCLWRAYIYTFLVSGMGPMHALGRVGAFCRKKVSLCSFFSRLTAVTVVAFDCRHFPLLAPNFVVLTSVQTVCIVSLFWGRAVDLAG